MRVREFFLCCAVLSVAAALRADDLWQEVKCPGRVVSLACVDSGDIYIGMTDAKGVARSKDGGTTWTAVNEGLDLSEAKVMVQALSTNRLGEVLAGIGYGGITPAPGEKRDPCGYRLEGNGNVWKRSAGLTANWFISSFTMDPKGILFAGTAWNGEVWRSTDDGRSYTKVAALSEKSAAAGTGPGAVWIVKVGPDGALYAQGEMHCGLLRSTDSGATWQDVGLSYADGYGGNLAAIGFNRQGEVLVGRVSHKTGAILQRLTKEGWVDSAQGLPPWGVCTAIVRNSSNRLFAGVGVRKGTECAVYTSADDAKTWQSFCSGLPQIASGKLVLDRKGVLYCLMAGRVFRTVNTTETTPNAPIR